RYITVRCCSLFFFFSSRRRHTRFSRDWSSDVCSSDLGEASLLAPLEYTGLLWSLMLDLAVWGVLPDSMTWTGAGIIIASGLYLLRRERIVHADDPDPPPPPGTLG